MPIDHTATFPAGPDDVLAVLTDEAFLRDYAQTLGARLESVDSAPGDGGPRTAVRLVVPTLGIPAVFTRFVGREVDVSDRRTWTADGNGGHRGVLLVETRILGRTAAVRGERRLRPATGGTRSTVTGEAEVDAPVVGRQAEAAVRELAVVVLRREDDVLRRWLGSPD
ncbi:DUF2505 domain-containing protein [Geodermatophilus sp. DSM 44513]|uniref:DUF2505 domain-containing protein n=1 Tax=Geodermatophilus sp. DSM 44513 TaxID=1528104 RepID=UPI00127488CC|nr:DUF2505 domain-containing protein [Geodermatophilus sp. DSM 44513]WNV77157.1 DUF2505 domain-containing protein [Geodermatophilus sp. DSM 44513]